MITDIRQLDLTKLYTYADYLTWRFPEWTELIFGKVFVRPPGQRLCHQLVLTELIGRIGIHFKGTKNRVLPGPVDLVLEDQHGVKNIVLQPDLMILCNPPKIEDDRNCPIPPNLVIEVLSKITRRRDRGDKFKVYEQYGVQEYWIIDEMNNEAEVYYAADTRKFELISRIREGEIIRSMHLPGLEINMDELFRWKQEAPVKKLSFREQLAEARMLRNARRL